jgi:hypothetical protein
MPQMFWQMSHTTWRPGCLIFGTGAAIRTTVVVVQCNSRLFVLAYLESQHTKFHAAGWTCWFFMSFYLESCIWLDVISQWIRHQVSVRFCVNLRKSMMETLEIIRQAFGQKVWALHEKSKLTETKKGEKGEEQREEHVHNFLWHQGDCSLIIRPGQTVNWAYYCDILRQMSENSPQTLVTKELTVAWQRTISHFPFH